MPYETATFDFIYTVNTIYFWKSLHDGLREINRTCKPGGMFVISFYDEKLLKKLPYVKNEFHFYSCEEIQNSLENHNFKIKKEIKKKGNMAISYICVRGKD